MAASQPIRIISEPGIKRDGTVFEGGNYIDALWCRFQRGLPRKIGGYRAISRYLSGIARTFIGYTRDTQTYVHAGSANAVERFIVDGNGNTSVISDRTPVALTADDNNMWQFDTIVNSGSTTNTLIAQVAPNLNCICNSLGGELYVGDLFGTAALTAVTTVPANWDCTGGVVTLHPYVMVFGQNGYVAWSIPGDPTDFTGAGAGNAYVTGQKILRGLPLRGGPGSTPSGLLWSVNSLIRVSYIGGTPIFDFDELTTGISVLGANTIIEYDGIYYWIGTDRFLMFNGVVREVPNNLNVNWFFDNLNAMQRQKVFAVKFPRFGEIWWCFPFGDADEPTHAIIYNVRENLWYDTELPNGGRGGGLSPEVFRRPIMSGVEPLTYKADGITINTAGTGYAAGDVLYADGGIYSIPVEITVDTVGGAGDITGVSITNIGSYTSVPTNPVSVITSGSGINADFSITFTQPYRLWIHETGVDEVTEQSTQPIRSYFETADISLPVLSGIDAGLQVLAVEADFVQTGDMVACAIGRQNARAPTVYSDPVTIKATAADPSEQLTYFKFSSRQLRFKFESNTLGGDYQMGHILGHVRPSDGTTIG